MSLTEGRGRRMEAIAVALGMYLGLPPPNATGAICTFSFESYLGFVSSIDSDYR